MEHKRFTDYVDYVFSAYGGALSTSARFRRLGEDLAIIAGKPEPWSRSYLWGLFTGSIQAPITDDMARALEALAKSFRNDDEIATILLTAQRSEVMTWAGNDLSDAYVIGSKQRCRHVNEDGVRCSVWFVSNHPRRKFCPQHGSPAPGAPPMYQNKFSENGG